MHKQSNSSLGPSIDEKLPDADFFTAYPAWTDNRDYIWPIL